MPEIVGTSGSSAICLQDPGEGFDSQLSRDLRSQTPAESGGSLLVIELYCRLRPLLEAYLCCLGLSQDQAQDVIQETFLRLVCHLIEQGGEDNLRAWVFRVAHNLSMDLHRLHRRLLQNNKGGLHPTVVDRVDPSPNPEQQVILVERMRRLEDAFIRLTPKQQRCVLLRAEGLRYRQIADILEISVQRVGEMMQRATRFLCSRLTAEGF